MADAGFEPAPFQTSALNWRLRPLGQSTIELYTKHKYTLHIDADHAQTKSTIPTTTALTHTTNKGARPTIRPTSRKPIIETPQPTEI
jgi:hypothetical protein